MMHHTLIVSQVLRNEILSQSQALRASVNHSLLSSLETYHNLHSRQEPVIDIYYLLNQIGKPHPDLGAFSIGKDLLPTRSEWRIETT